MSVYWRNLFRRVTPGFETISRFSSSLVTARSLQSLASCNLLKAHIQKHVLWKVPFRTMAWFTYPNARRDETVEVLHGKTVIISTIFT